MDGNEIKLVAFADDVTSFVRDKQSHNSRRRYQIIR